MTINIQVFGSLSLLQLINIRWVSKNGQHQVLSYPDYNSISIDNYQHDIFKTFMLSLCVFFTCSLTLGYLELMAK